MSRPVKFFCSRLSKLFLLYMDPNSPNSCLKVESPKFCRMLIYWSIRICIFLYIYIFMMAFYYYYLMYYWNSPTYYLEGGVLLLAKCTFSIHACKTFCCCNTTANSHCTDKQHQTCLSGFVWSVCYPCLCPASVVNWPKDV